ncbi:MAG: hypothetical protein O2780_13720, partial [Proteobacteria bacterium]|nr:hypothetical protein [Pseudomonadota bacterium]
PGTRTWSVESLLWIHELFEYGVKYRRKAQALPEPEIENDFAAWKVRELMLEREHETAHFHWTWDCPSQ